jgi:hypothetical protein
MKALARIATISLLVAAGCAHTKTTDNGSEKAAKPSEEAKTERPRARSSGADEPAKPRGEHAIPVASSPGGLLAPGADGKIRERLAVEGFLDDDAKRTDGAMSDGLRRFQRAHDLPATGIPDHQTVKDLGLDPDQIFRQGPVKD